MPPETLFLQASSPATLPFLQRVRHDKECVSLNNDLPHLPVVGDVDIVRKQLPIVVTFYEKPLLDSAI